MCILARQKCKSKAIMWWQMIKSTKNVWKYMCLGSLIAEVNETEVIDQYWKMCYLWVFLFGLVLFLSPLFPPFFDFACQDSERCKWDSENTTNMIRFKKSWLTLLSFQWTNSAAMLQGSNGSFITLRRRKLRWILNCDENLSKSFICWV